MEMSSALMNFGLKTESKFFEKEPEEIFLDMGYAPLNKILSGNAAGGLPQGRVSEIYGPAASGKTVLATLAMIQAQRQGGIAVFCDWENAFTLRFAEQLGLDPRYPCFKKITPFTFEEGIDLVLEWATEVRKEKAIPDSAPIVAVFDSIAAAVPRSVLYDAKGEERDLGTRNMNDSLALAKATSAHMPRIAQKARLLNMTVIFLNQLREKPGIAYGSPTYTPGGKSPEFVASMRLEVSSKKITSAGPEKEFKGRLMQLKTTKSKSTSPYQTTELRLVYEEDGRAVFDFTTGYIDELCAMGKLEDKGGRVTWEGKAYWKAVLAKKIDEEGAIGKLIELYMSNP